VAQTQKTSLLNALLPDLPVRKSLIEEHALPAAMEGLFASPLGGGAGFDTLGRGFGKATLGATGRAHMLDVHGRPGDPDEEPAAKGRVSANPGARRPGGPLPPGRPGGDSRTRRGRRQGGGRQAAHKRKIRHRRREPGKI